MRSPEIRTARLLLRPHRIADAETWFQLQSNPDVIRYMSWPARTRTESFVHLAHRTRHDRLEQADDFLALAVVLEDQLIGDVSLHLRTLDPPRLLEIGWIIDPRWQGQGYAREATQAMLELAFNQLHAGTVEAHIAWPNHASIALARRLGFEDVGEVEAERIMAIHHL